ncbi:hypothetical protein [Microbacterium maritypicum]
MTHQDAPKGSYNGALRWYVHRQYSAPARFGETHGPLIWVVTQIIQGTGSKGLPIGAPTRFGQNRDAALAYAHNQQRLLYGPRKDRS